MRKVKYLTAVAKAYAETEPPYSLECLSRISQKIFGFPVYIDGDNNQIVGGIGDAYVKRGELWMIGLFEPGYFVGRGKFWLALLG